MNDPSVSALRQAWLRGDPKLTAGTLSQVEGIFLQRRADLAGEPPDVLARWGTTMGWALQAGFVQGRAITGVAFVLSSISVLPDSVEANVGATIPAPFDAVQAEINVVSTEANAPNLHFLKIGSGEVGFIYAPNHYGAVMVPPSYVAIDLPNPSAACSVPARRRGFFARSRVSVIAHAVRLRLDGQWQESPPAVDPFDAVLAAARRSPQTTTAPKPDSGQPHQSQMPGLPEQPLLEAEGNGGHVWVFQDKVRIKHHGVRGFVTKGFLKGDKEIWIDQIAGLQWREPGSLWLGHLQFEVIGGVSSTKVASEDENAVMFDASRRAAFEQLKLLVEQRMREIRNSRNAPQVAAPSAPDIPEQITKLASLRDAGILTNEEFEAKKAELLARM